MTIPQKNALEWSVFAVSLLLLLGVAGVLIYDLVWGDDTPPAFVVSVGEPTERGELLELPIIVENRGGQSARDLLVAITVRQSGGESTAELRLPLLPRRASDEAVVLLPRQGELQSVEGRVISFVQP
jgi:uncharacterized protein (TIGR02588 family)